MTRRRIRFGRGGEAPEGGLIVFGLGDNRFEIFSFEDLPAVETLDVIDAIPAGNN